MRDHISRAHRRGIQRGPHEVVPGAEIISPDGLNFFLVRLAVGGHRREVMVVAVEGLPLSGDIDELKRHPIGIAGSGPRPNPSAKYPSLLHACYGFRYSRRMRGIYSDGWLIDYPSGSSSSQKEVSENPLRFLLTDRAETQIQRTVQSQVDGSVPQHHSAEPGDPHLAEGSQ